jgi:catechol 2,3-dioxygenase-like lactoylglutathione lyase family enzyme
MAERVSVTGLDHIVLNVSDPERSLDFYCDTLGLVPERVDEWRHGDVPFPSVRVNSSTIIDLVTKPRQGENVDHFCLVVQAMDFGGLKEQGQLRIVDGPGVRYGARGNGTSIYVRDPDDNVIELRYYV